MTRYLITDPGTAARPAKNSTAAPGLPNQPHEDSKGRNFMLPQSLIRRAAERTGYRDALVAAPVEIIARRFVEDRHTPKQIAEYLQHQLGEDNAVASLEFVTWVIGEVASGGGTR